MQSWIVVVHGMWDHHGAILVVFFAAVAFAGTNQFSSVSWWGSSRPCNYRQVERIECTVDQSCQLGIPLSLFMFLILESALQRLLWVLLQVPANLKFYFTEVAAKTFRAPDERPKCFWYTHMKLNPLFTIWHSYCWCSKCLNALFNNIFMYHAHNLSRWNLNPAKHQSLKDQVNLQQKLHALSQQLHLLHAWHCRKSSLFFSTMQILNISSTYMS